MAEDSGQEKTEAASPRKRDDARRDGKIPRSPELNTAVLLLGASVVMSALGPGLAGRMVEVMQGGLALAGSRSLERASTVQLLQTFGWKVFTGTAAVILSLGLLAGATAAVQARGVVTWKPLEPKLERLNPGPKLKQFFSFQPWLELLKSLVKLGVVGVALWTALGSAWSDSLGLAQTTPLAMTAVVSTYGVRLLRTAGLCYLAFAGADYLYQVWKFEREMRMTKEEVKEEAKQNEGSGMVKARMRAMGRSLARRQMFQEVPTADVVVTNPTHIAVALKYDPARSDAPVVVAMGQRKIAERIKQIAREAGVPTVENRPLARALLASARVGTPIPPELYLAVAEVLAWVISQRGRLRSVVA